MHMLIRNSQHRLQLHDFRCIKVSVMCNVHHVCMFVQVWKVQLLCIAVCLHVCTLMRLCVCAFVRMCVCVGVSGLGQWADPLRHPSDPPHPPSCDGLSWMLMFCDGCGANKCFWHSTGSHYRTRPNGLASALMSRQISQPQPLYQSNTLLMQGRTSTPLTRPKEKLTLASAIWKPPQFSVFL